MNSLKITFEYTFENIFENTFDQKMEHPRVATSNAMVSTAIWKKINSGIFQVSLSDITFTAKEIKSKNWKNEIQVLIQTNHPNIVSSHEIMKFLNLQKPIVWHNHMPYIVMESMNSGDLFECISKKEYLPEYLAIDILIEISTGLDYLHENNFVHRDIKPENILLDTEKGVKICDFDLTQSSDTYDCKSGTCAYMAPEIFKGSYDGKKGDIWALGITFFVMLMGLLPFKPSVHSDPLFRRIQNKGWHELWKHHDESPYTTPKLSTYSKELALSMLHIDPERRVTTKQLIQKATKIMSFDE